MNPSRWTPSFARSSNARLLLAMEKNGGLLPWDHDETRRRRRPLKRPLMSRERSARIRRIYLAPYPS